MTTISASSTTGIYLTSPSYTNPVTINSGVTISSSVNGVYGFTGSWTITNNGSIKAPLYSGVYLGAGGLVTNAASASISGFDGVNITGGIGTVINNGSIAGSSASSIGVILGAGGGVTNQGSGTISGYTGVDLTAGGTVTNAASASITGIYEGLGVSGGAGTVVNDGDIAGTGVGGIGIILGSGGTIVNAASASITGNVLGVDLSAGGTLANAGTVVGNAGTAVAFGGTGSNLLVLYPGYRLSGIAIGGTSAVNTLELASAASAGTLSGLGTEFVDFAQVTVASNATWQLAGTNTLAAGATITNSGTLIPADATLTGSGVLINDGVILLDGASSNWQIGGTLIDGDATSGALDINAGASVIATSLDVAGPAGGDGVIAVTGTGSSLGLSGSLTVGAYGAGVLSILDGATVSALDVTIGSANALSSGNVDLEGSGSTLLITAGGVLNIGVADGGSGVLTVGTGAVLNFDGTIVESGQASFNNDGGVIDPDAIEFVTESNSGDGINDYDLWVDNIGAVQIASGTGTWTTPMVLTGTSVTDASTNVSNGDLGEWQLSQDGTLIINANTVDAGQAIVFEDATDTLVIGQVVNGGSAGISGVQPTIAAGAENLLAAGGFAAEIWGYQAGDEILFNNLTVTADSIVGGNTLDIYGPGDTFEGALTFYDKSGTAPLDTEGMNAAAAQVVCFCKGTLIATPDGEVAVEQLQPGDHVMTLRGEVRRIVWIGAGRVATTRGQRDAATPVIVHKGALDDNVPHHDLRVTKGHSFYLDGVLIPVEFLVNHRSIAWDDRAQEVEIFHIELETHDVLMANGAPAESYRDDGNRWLFCNANSGWGLPPQKPCAQVLTGGPIVDAVWRRLIERAGPRPGLPITDDPDLHLMVDGQRVDVVLRNGDWHIFRLTAPPATVRIVSRTGVPQEMGLSRDPRCLGVALRQMMVTQGARIRTIDAEDALLQDNFHGYEADNDIRWTYGDAGVPARLFEEFAGPLELALRLGGKTCYPE
jgi:T5SS/PEP-CTERM-associated repeat protein